MRPTAARRGKVEHLGGGQPPLPVDAERTLGELLSIVGGRLGVDVAAWGIRFPEMGEYYLVGQVPDGLEAAGRAVAVALSIALPEHWLVMGRLFLRAGRFHRRRRGYRLELVPATDVHLPRDLRAKLRGLV